MRIFVISAYGYWGSFNPNDLRDGDHQIGGGETAMLSIARELAHQGHEVFVFYDVDRPGQYEGVDFLPTSLYVAMAVQVDHDVLVSWDAPHAFRYADRAKKRVLAFQLNDTYVGVYDWAIDYYFHPSRWHLNRFKELYPEISSEKQKFQMTNGIDYGRYLRVDLERDPYRVIYSSSPDRGLHHLLRVWPRIVEAIPQANLRVFYDVSKWLSILKNANEEGRVLITSERGNLIADAVDNPPPGVAFYGGVGQRTLAEEQLSAAVMAYPCDPVQPTEGFSMSILEGIASGCDVITTDVDALPELWSNAPGVTILPSPVDDELWVDTIVQKLRNGGSRTPRVREDLSWKNIAAKWTKVLTDDNRAVAD